MGKHFLNLLIFIASLVLVAVVIVQSVHKQHPGPRKAPGQQAAPAVTTGGKEAASTDTVQPAAEPVHEPRYPAVAP